MEKDWKQLLADRLAGGMKGQAASVFVSIAKVSTKTLTAIRQKQLSTIPSPSLLRRLAQAVGQPESEWLALVGYTGDESRDHQIYHAVRYPAGRKRRPRTGALSDSHEIWDFVQELAREPLTKMTFGEFKELLHLHLERRHVLNQLRHASPQS